MTRTTNFQSDRLPSFPNNHFHIPDNILREWQSILDLLARIEKAKAALIMKISGDDLEVLLSSKTSSNPYRVGNKQRYVGSGLYCERVLRQGEMLMVPDATQSAEWRHNPDMKYDMKCYLGFPIKLPTGGYFGTICVLDTEPNNYSQDMKDCMEKMRDLIETNLLLIYLSAIDQLTGLYNRTCFNRHLGTELNLSQQRLEPLSAMMLDIDHFKTINDTRGHLAGDEALAGIAKVILGSLREQDMAFRIGGDEFFVSMPDTPLNDALKAAKKLCDNVKNSNIVPGLPVTTSIGVAEHLPGESPDDWYNRIDRALYRAKKLSGNLAVT